MLLGHVTKASGHPLYLLINALCGVTQAELSGLVSKVLQHCGHDETQYNELLQTLKQFYNGYHFCDDLDKPLLYNPILCFYFLHHYQDECKAPRQMLDGKLMLGIANLVKRALYVDELRQRINCHHPPPLR